LGTPGVCPELRRDVTLQIRRLLACERAGRNVMKINATRPNFRLEIAAGPQQAQEPATIVLMFRHRALLCFRCRDVHAG
jgi:hypothetical protein